MIQFDIIVPTYKRYDALPKFFQENAALEHLPIMIWMIDDGTPDLNLTVVPNWSNLKFITLEENRGQAYARNIAIAKGNAPYIISLDDDAWFVDAKDSLSKLSTYFDKYPETGCFMFNIATPVSDYSSDRSQASIVQLHITCGCAYRRQVIEGIGGFSGFLHSGAEETDLSLRIYSNGWKIRFLSDVKVFHNFIPSGRSLSWYLDVRFNTTRNDLLIILMYYPWQFAAPFVLGKFLNHLRFAYTNRISVLKTVQVTCQAFLDFLRMSPQALKRRKPLPLNTFTYWRSLS